MDPKFYTVEELLKSNLFSIPKYQRPYSWTKDELDDLFSDILTVHSTNKIHFMATLVTVQLDSLRDKGLSFNRLEVVDGQQRLTSISILLKALANILPNNNGIKKTINQLLVKNNNSDLVIINTNYDTQSIFSDFIRRGKEPEEGFIPRTITEEKLLTAIQLSKKFLQNKEIFTATEDIERFYDTIVLKLKFLLHVLDDKESVYTTFEVLNSRGRTVDTIDKCKSILLGRTAQMSNSKEAIDDVSKRWEQIFGEIGIVKINTDEVVRMGVTILDKSITRNIKSTEDSIEFFKKASADFDTILDWHNILVQIAKISAKLAKNKKLKALLDTIQVKFLFIVLHMRNDEEPIPGFENILSQLENVSFRTYGLAGLDSRNKKGDYFELAQKIMENVPDIERLTPDEIKAEIKKLGNDFKIEDVVEKISKKDLYESTNWREELRYFFYKYEEYLTKQKNQIINDQLWTQIWANTADSSIEHILPQKAKSNPDWSSVIEEFNNDPKEEKICVNRLGNLMILAPETNSKASNKSFKEKKEIYHKGSYLLSVEDVVVGNNTWNKRKIEIREKKLLAAAKEIWKDVY